MNSNKYRCVNEFVTVYEHPKCEGTPHRYLMSRGPDPVKGGYWTYVMCKPCYQGINPDFKQLFRKITKAEYAVAQIMFS